MAKILLSMSNSILVNNKYVIPCFYEQLIEELEKNGNEILVFIPQLFNARNFCSENPLKAGISEDNLRQQILAFKPDVVFSFNNVNYNKILEVTDCKIVIWDADTLCLWNQRKLIKNNLERYVYFAFSEYYINRTKEYFGFKESQCHNVPLATNFKAQKVEQNANISFIGTRFAGFSPIEKIIKAYSGDDELKKIFGRIHKFPFITSENLLYDIENKKLLEEWKHIDPSEYNCIFSAEDRIQGLLNICDLGLKLYGDPGWYSFYGDFPSLASCYIPEKIYSAKQNEDIYNTSKICINFIHAQSIEGIPWRVPEILATNGCLVSSYTPYLVNSFKKYVKIPTFSNSFEARDLCQKLLKDDKWREDIVRGSNEAINAEWRWEQRFKQMEEIFGFQLTGNQTKGHVDIMYPKFVSNSIQSCFKKHKSFKNKIRYKIWKHLGKKLRKKGVI